MSCVQFVLPRLLFFCIFSVRFWCVLHAKRIYTGFTFVIWNANRVYVGSFNTFSSALFFLLFSILIFAFFFLYTHEKHEPRRLWVAAYKNNYKLFHNLKRHILSTFLFLNGNLLAYKQILSERLCIIWKVSVERAASLILHSFSLYFVNLTCRHLMVTLQGRLFIHIFLICFFVIWNSQRAVTIRPAM